MVGVFLNGENNVRVDTNKSMDVAWANPLSPVLANIFMGKLEAYVVRLFMQPAIL